VCNVERGTERIVVCDLYWSYVALLLWHVQLARECILIIDALNPI